MALDLQGKDYLLEPEEVLEDKDYKYYYILGCEWINNEWSKPFYYEKLEESTIDGVNWCVSLILKEDAKKFNTQEEAEEELKYINQKVKDNPNYYDESTGMFKLKLEIAQE